ncbi:MAG TPA: hypothetical protein VNL18_01305, partial [Gemmatimonadales bacterium]|nr:hypothetical protein [Gemmatimonadales bacterium]
MATTSRTASAIHARSFSGLSAWDPCAPAAPKWAHPAPRGEHARLGGGRLIIALADLGPAPLLGGNLPHQLDRVAGERRPAPGPAGGHIPHGEGHDEGTGRVDPA